MSSRAQDSQRLATLATQLNDLAAGLVKIVGVIEQINNDLAALSTRVADMDEALDRLERRG
jgi:septal ring factor EnvC (AmiA/AmiB activator)